MDKFKIADLKKLTAVKLREMADEFEEIKGASGMNKELLVETLAASLRSRSLLIEEELHSNELDRLEKDRLKFKPEMKVLIKKKKELLADHDHDPAELKDVRDRIKRLRRKIHRTHIREEQLKIALKLKS